jgi:hypothetical protein
MHIVIGIFVIFLTTLILGATPFGADLRLSVFRFLRWLYKFVR